MAGEILKVYDTRENAKAGGSTGLIDATTIFGSLGGVGNTEDLLPFYIYNKYYYRIEANEPVAEFHIDWDDGEDNSEENANVQIIKNKTPRSWAVVPHVYTEHKTFYPLFRLKSWEGFLSKWYTSYPGRAKFLDLDKEPTHLAAEGGQNYASIVNVEKTGVGRIPFITPSNYPPIGVLKTDKKRIYAGIDNDMISSVTLPSLYAFTDSTAGSLPQVKYTLQGANMSSIREYTGEIFKEGDVDFSGPAVLNPASISGFDADYSDAVPSSLDSLDDKDDVYKVLKVELTNASLLADTDRVYIKVFDRTGGGTTALSQTVTEAPASSKWVVDDFNSNAGGSYADVTFSGAVDSIGDAITFRTIDNTLITVTSHATTTTYHDTDNPTFYPYGHGGITSAPRVAENFARCINAHSKLTAVANNYSALGTGGSGKVRITRLGVGIPRPNVDKTVAILSNGNPILDGVDPFFSCTVDASESRTITSNLDIEQYKFDTDKLLTGGAVQAQSSDQISDVLSTTATTIPSLTLSYTHDTRGHIFDDDSRFLPFTRLVRVQVEDDSDAATSPLANFLDTSFIEHWDDDQYTSTVNTTAIGTRDELGAWSYAAGRLRMPTSLESRGGIWFTPLSGTAGSIAAGLGAAIWKERGADNINDTAMIFGGAVRNHELTASAGTGVPIPADDYILPTSVSTWGHPENYLCIAKEKKFDRLHIRTDNESVHSELLNNQTSPGYQTTVQPINTTAYYATTNGWKPLSIVDGTQGLSTSGAIYFDAPEDWKAIKARDFSPWVGPVDDSIDIPATQEKYILEFAADTVNNDTSSTSDGYAVKDVVGNFDVLYGKYIEIYKSLGAGAGESKYYVWFLQAAKSEITYIDIVTSNTKDQLIDDYIILHTPYAGGSSFLFWFQVNGGQSKPEDVADYTCEVDISGGGTVTDDHIAAILEARIDDLAGLTEGNIGGSAIVVADQFTAEVVANRIQATCLTAGESVDATTTDATYTTITINQQGKDASENPSASHAALSSGYAGNSSVAYDDGDSAVDMAAATATVINAISGFTAVVNSGVDTSVNVTCDTAGTVTNAVLGTASSVSGGDNLAAPITINITEVAVSGFTPDQGTNIADTGEDPGDKWDFDAYGILLAFDVQYEGGYDELPLTRRPHQNIRVRNVWPFNNSHSQLITVEDPHHVSLNSISLNQSISFGRTGKFIQMENKFGKSDIRRVGAAGGKITFGAVDLGGSVDERATVVGYQKRGTPVFLDLEHRSDNKTRFFGVIESISEDYPAGKAFPKFAINMIISHIIELSSTGVLTSGKISIGGELLDEGTFFSQT